MLSFLFSPSGRIGRAQWWGVQAMIILTIVFAVFPLLTMPTHEVDLYFYNYWQVMCVGLVLIFWTNLCAVIKRYHDRGKSGWWYLVCLIPTIGGIWQLVECGFLSGEANDNQYGPASGGPSKFTEQDFAPAVDRGGLPNRFDRAIEEAVMAQRRPVSTETVTTYQQPFQNNQPSNGRPVFGKRV